MFIKLFIEFYSTLSPSSQRVIPTFPDFKPLELADRSQVDAVARLFPPYSDFNFTNMYAWDTQGAMRLSRLHGNIVVQFIDYLSEAVFLSFIGHQRIAETAGALLAMAKQQFKAAVLRFIPEEVAQILAAHGFAVTQDHDASDYVYAVDHLAGMHQWAGRRSRSRIRQFAARYPDYSIRHQPLALIDPAEYRALFMTWARRRNGSAPDASNEYRAFERFLHMPAEIEVVALYANAGLVGFSSFELMRHDTAIVHFSKTDHGFHPGVCDVLYWEEAKVLQAKGIKHYNWEQDMGLPGLQQSKKKYEPCHFLKKFTVSES
jgi:hypothetical protein